ncbi:MAG TPA: hypothetical protein VFH97_02900 [Gemmatimonadales bacterium]|nr:hypothetical protein [Gemmatimonadales bacterium]
MRSLVAALVVAVGLQPPGPAGAQSLSDRIARVRDGTVRLSFATRPTVCGDGQFIGFDLPDAFYQYSSGNDGYSVNVLRDVTPECRGGPLRLVVVKLGGRVAELRAAVGVSWRASATAVDLGTVAAPEAADWLVGQAERADDGVARIGLLAAAAADSARIAGRVLALVQNRRLPVALRERAIRWSAVIAGAEGRGDDVDRLLRDLAGDAAEPVGLRERAVRDLRPTGENRAHLKALYGSVGETSLRERILREVASGGGAAEVAWLRGIALDSREAVGLRDRAIRLLAERGQVGYLRELYPRLDRIELRERVVRSVAEGQDGEAAAWLERIVLDEGESPALRDRAVRSLAEQGRSSVALAALYDRLASTALKQRLIRLLSERRDEAAAEKLARIADGDRDPGLRSEAARRRK